MGSIYDWSTTASDNGASDATVNFAEGQTPASLNNSARAVMARVAAWLKGLGAAITHGGSSNAYTLTLPTGHTITAYATGMRFLWKPNGNSSGSVTLNVDGVGAKKVYLPSGVQAGSGHITSGTLIDVAYDAMLDSSAGGFQIVGSSSAIASQPLDATLTALAALSWSSGNALLQFTAADTVSLTLTPSVSSVTAQNSAGASTVAARFVNTTDSASVTVASFEGDRATPANSDFAQIDYKLSNAAGTQTAFGRLLWLATDVTAGSEDGYLLYYVVINGTLTGVMRLTGTSFQPQTNDGAALGTTSAGWADLHLATGGVVNWANGLVTLTHDATNDCLEVAGGGFSAPFEQVTGVGGETLTVAHRNRELILDGNITMPNSVFAAGDWQVLIGDGSARTITRGSGVTMYVNGVDSATATLGARQIGGAAWETASVVYLSGAVT